MSTSQPFRVNGNACVIEVPGFWYHQTRVYRQQVLETGSLSYIDGGTNDTALPPNRLGGPVVNYVHFPAGMYQTLHTHPSQRIGMVLGGKGKIELNHNQYHYLNEGEVFSMDRNELHNFICEDDSDVTLFVWAPDSGSGPTDEVNPLQARTYIGQARPGKNA
ncbi:cupin domain-containing protein [Endozoicomonas ascidiicola]|uniref:cupin domain-containing protein n=1 Tax=Endozoicomonas ascidiicola TaxID=1698521 RepID=UPI0012F97371|nr:cupin domain-containing protein [Endozoicomonas ascidiicola]